MHVVHVVLVGVPLGVQGHGVRVEVHGLGPRQHSGRGGGGVELAHHVHGELLLLVPLQFPEDK